MKKSSDFDSVHEYLDYLWKDMERYDKLVFYGPFILNITLFITTIFVIFENAVILLAWYILLANILYIFGFFFEFEVREPIRIFFSVIKIILSCLIIFKAGIPDGKCIIINTGLIHCKKSLRKEIYYTQ